MSTPNITFVRVLSAFSRHGHVVIDGEGADDTAAPTIWVRNQYRLLGVYRALTVFSGI